MNKRIVLIAKFTFSISLILLLFMGMLDYLNLKNFRKVMVDYAVLNADEVANIITQSTYDAMLKNDKSSLYTMIARIAESENIEHIRLINQNGKVIYSKSKDEIGSAIGIHADECLLCHYNMQSDSSTLPEKKCRIVRSRSGKEALAFTKTIYNQPACFTASCHFHGRNETMLGQLDIAISLEHLQRKSSEYRLQFIMLTCLLLLMTGALITILIHYLVGIPVQRLVRQSTLVAAGEYGARVPVTSNDELGALAEAMNAVTESLERSDRELKSWAESLEQKVEERSREIMRMEEQLRRSEKLASLGTLAAGVAHEINNPLTGILLYASLLNSDKRLDPALLPDVERVISETSRCADIVKNLLEFSRESMPVKKSIALETILDDIIAFFQNQPAFRDITIHKEYQENLPHIFVDPSQIKEVFINLVINAGHAMPNGGELTLVAYCSADGSSVCTEVRDTGSGIPPENLARIFDPFFTTKPDGTGLGLSISYGIIESNGGTIEVQSRVGEGSTFIVKLPAAG